MSINDADGGTIFCDDPAKGESGTSRTRPTFEIAGTLATFTSSASVVRPGRVPRV